MSSSDAILAAACVHFQYVNERAAHIKIDRAAHVKIDRVSHRCRPGLKSTSDFSCCRILSIKIKRLWENKEDFFKYVCKIFVPRSEGPPLNTQ